MSRVLPVVIALIVVFFAWQFVSLMDDKHAVLNTWQNDELEKFQIDSELYPNYFKTKAGIVLATQHYLIPNPRGIIFIFHGFTEHQQRYAGLAYEFNKMGLAAVTLDHVGHGSSQGDHSFITSFDDYVNDAIEFMNHQYYMIQNKIGPYGIETFNIQEPSYYEDKLFIFGHSMGGLISTHVGIQHTQHPEKFSFKSQPKFLLSAPALALDKKLTDAPVMIALANYLSAYLPRLVVQVMPSVKLSNIDFVSKLAERDPLIRGPNVVARFGHEFLRSIQFVHDNAKSFTAPLVIFHSKDDNIVSIEGSELFLTEVATPADKQKLVYVNGYHEIVVDLDRKDILSNMKKFIYQHLPTPIVQSVDNN